MKTAYNYAIIKRNYPELERESVLLDNKYKKSKRYAYICKLVHKDGSESIAFINYSSNLQELQERASQLPSWYNYPMGIYKDMQGNVSHLN